MLIFFLHTTLIHSKVNKAVINKVCSDIEYFIKLNVGYLFTRGKSDMTIGRKIFKDVPRILITLIQHLTSIMQVVMHTPAIDLSEHWQIKTSEKKKLNNWVELVDMQARKIHNATHLNIKEMIENSIYLSKNE